MKRHTLWSTVLSIILVGVLIGGCSGGDLAPSTNGSNSPPAQTTEPTTISQQTRVVLAEMFTGDW